MAEIDPAWLLGFLKLPCSSTLAMVPEEKPTAEPAMDHGGMHVLLGSMSRDPEGWGWRSPSMTSCVAVAGKEPCFRIMIEVGFLG